MPTLLLIDGSNYLYRAYHGLPDLRTSQGEPTGAIKGFANMLQMIKNMVKPDLAACVFDAHGPTFRNSIFSDYKANRPPMPEDLSSQVEPILEMIKAQGWPLLQVPGIEADDVIGTLSCQARAQGMKVFIATGDKDMSQLVTEEVVVVNTMTRQVLDSEAVKEKFGVPPERIVDYLSLMGDAVDNVPGIYKCGPKTAAKWINDFGDLDSLMARANEVKGKAGEYLREGISFLPTARELVTIKTDADLSEYLPQGLSELSFKAPDDAFLATFYDRWEMQQSKRKTTQKIAHQKTEKVSVASDSTLDLFASIPVEDEAQTSQAQTQEIQILTLDEDLKTLSKDLKSTSDVAGLSVFSEGTEGLRAPLTGLALSFDNRNVYIPIKHSSGENASVESVRSLLGDWLAASTPKVTSEGKFARHVLANEAIDIHSSMHDVTMMSYVIEAHMKHEIGNLAMRWLKTDIMSEEDVRGKGVKALASEAVAIDLAARYACQRAQVARELMSAMYPRIQADEGLKTIYETVELPAQNVLFIMERNGVLIDSMRLGAQSDALGDQIVRLEEQCYELAGQKFNVASPKQLSHVLFDVLGLPVPPKTKKTASGGYSTNEEVLTQLALDFPLPKIILEFRRLSKLKSTYTDKLPLMVLPSTGRVHTTFGQTTAVTGRLASSDPNLQNIPVRTEEGRRVREAFVADQGKVIVSADYSQIELRIMAHLSQDKGLLDAFHKDLDIHRATASEVFGVPLEAVTSDQRRTAKVINFGLIYGMSAFGLAQNLGIEPSAARNYIERYFSRYPGVKTYMEKTRELAHQQGFVETAFGRRLWLPDIQSSKAPVRAAAERAAINAPMQGTAADLIKKAMIAVQKWIEEKALKSLLVLQVHDELVLEVPEEELDLVKVELPKLMQDVASLAVPLLAEVGSGESWESAH